MLMINVFRSQYPYNYAPPIIANQHSLFPVHAFMILPVEKQALILLLRSRKQITFFIKNLKIF